MESSKAVREPQAGHLIQRVEDHLHHRGVRMTRARRLVVWALDRAPGPQSAADLDETLGGAVPLSSLYRTLAVLDRAGIVERLHDPNGLARYELAEWLAGHHHHLVCVECGTARDIELEEALEETMEDLALLLASRMEFDVSGHRLELEGTCGRCRT